MGAHTFSNYTETKDPQVAYRELGDAANYEYGNNGYNGTIGTTSGFAVIQREPISPRKAFAMEKAEIDSPNCRADKWGNALAIRVKGVTKGRKLNGWIFFGWAAS